MTQEKLKAIVKLATAGAVILLAILFVSLTYQFVVLGNLKKQNAELDAQINALTEYNVQLNNELEYFNNSEALEDYYRANGYSKEGEVNIK